MPCRFLALGSVLRWVVLAVSTLLLMSAVLGLAGEKAGSEEEIRRTNANPAAAPSPRIESGMAYDAESDRIILFGGTSKFGVLSVEYFLDDTWSYDLNLDTWTDMNPAEAPSRRWGTAMAYDAESDRVILFGGGLPALSDETWAYDFNTNTWTKMEPTTRPSRRVPVTMAYDAESDRIVLFGGWAGAPDDETWTYDFNSNTWTKMQPTTRPSRRVESSLAYDAESDRVILFGGATSAGDNDETWAYDFNTNTWTKMQPATRPSRRHSPVMAFDAESDRVVLFGGHLVGFSDETWAYDFNTDTWTNMEPPTQPLKRAGHKLAYDAESDRVVLFGGDDPNVALSDETWVYDLNANTWTDLTPTTTSSAPLTLQATAGDAQVDLTWSPPSDDGGSPITGHRVWRGTVSGALAFLIAIGNVQMYSDTDVTNDVTYYYAVAAENSRGVGPQSSQASATPTAPPDTTSPSISIVSPMDGSSLASTSVTVTGTASDDIAVEKVELSTDATTWALATGTTSWSVALTLAEGENTLFARATDTSGNVATMSIAVTVVPPMPGLLTSPLVLTVGIGAGVAAVAAVAALLILRRRGKGKGEG